MVDRLKPNQQSVASLPESTMISLSIARAKLKVRLEEIKSLSPKEADAFYKGLEQFIQPSVIFDSAATESAREMAEKSI